MSGEFSETTSTTLLGRVKADDPQAWRRLSQLYAPLVYRWARQAGLQDTDAADIVQEVFRAVFTAIKDYRHQRFRGWLWTITRNQVRQHYRKRAALPQAEGGTDAQRNLQQLPEFLESEQDPADTDTETSLTQRALQLIRDEFETNTWRAFWRATIDNQSAREIGEDLGMTPGAVRTAKYRVLCRLKVLMEGM